MLVLDTSLLIEIEKGNTSLLEKLVSLRSMYPENPAITSAIYAEFLFGFIKIGKQSHAEKYSGALDILDFDLKAARIFAELKKDLEDKGKMIPIFDLVTASTVIARSGTLVTFDRHFENVAALDMILLL